jgi:hypothetical protein
MSVCMEIITIKVRMEEIILLCRMLEVCSLLLWKSITRLLDSGWQCCISVPPVLQLCKDRWGYQTVVSTFCPGHETARHGSGQ